MGEHQEAVPYLKKSLAIALKHGPPHLVINNMNELSAIDLLEGEPDSALARSQDALRRTLLMGRSFGDYYFNFHLWESNFILGSAYEAKGMWPLAVRHYTTADSAASASDFEGESIKSRIHLALAFFASDPTDPSRSKKLLEVALVRARELGLLADQRDILIGLSQVNERSGDQRGAMENLKAYIIIKDSILDLEKMRAITCLLYTSPSPRD